MARCVDVAGWLVCWRAVAAAVFVLMVGAVVICAITIWQHERQRRAGPELPAGRTRVGIGEGSNRP